MSLEFPDHPRWDKVLEVLLEPRAAGHDKRPACLLMAKTPDRLPADVRSALAANAASVAESQPGIGLEADIGGIETMLGIVLMPVGQDAATEITKLAVGTPEQRRDAAMLLGWGQQPHQQPLLAALSADPHPQVRHEAARAIGKLGRRRPQPGDPLSGLGIGRRGRDPATRRSPLRPSPSQLTNIGHSIRDRTTPPKTSVGHNSAMGTAHPPIAGPSPARWQCRRAIGSATSSTLDLGTGDYANPKSQQRGRSDIRGTAHTHEVS